MSTNITSRLQSLPALDPCPDERQPPAINSRSVEYHVRTKDTLLDYVHLSKLRFAVIGAGALGNEVVKALGLLGVGWTLIVDPDIVEPHNLSQSLFFREADTGLAKAEVLARALADIFSDTHWDHRVLEIADLGLQELANCDLLLSCVDTDVARVEIARAALALNLPVVDAGLGGPDYWRGRVSFFAGQGAACFFCKLSPRRRREILLHAQSVPNSCWGSAGTGSVPSTPTMAGIIGSMQVDIGIRSLFELRGSTAPEFLSWTLELSMGATLEMKRFSTRMSASCPFHIRQKPALVALPHAKASARELLDSAGMQTVELDWPICVSAYCIECGAAWNPSRRVAWLRRQGKCPVCQGRRVLEKENLLVLDRNSPWAEKPLVDLGLPERHLYSLGCG